VDILFRIIHTGTFNVGIQALMLIFQVSSRQQAISDRFYRILYDTLVDSRLAVCSKQAMYLNLVFKAIKADTSSKRVAAFVKRITQILAVHQPPFVCGALYLLGEVRGLRTREMNVGLYATPFSALRHHAQLAKHVYRAGRRR
jgi:ribosome biogenesis protein MAK21